LRILLIGSGGREHALAWKLVQSPAVEALYALPGSDAIGSIAQVLEGDPLDPIQTAAAAERLKCDLTVVGPEAPLAAGVADELQRRGLQVFGPTRAAAQLETSKVFAKRFMQRRGIPTADFAAAHSIDEARRILPRFSYPLVLKADGLAAGKGVVITETPADAERTLERMFSGELVGAAGSSVVIEEFLSGPEVSLLVISDGNDYELLVPAQDHKRVFDGDRGPNTGGMGAYSLDGLLSASEGAAVEAKIVRPVLAAMRSEGMAFSGVLYCGLIMTSAGAKVLEFNVRFGDPEAQAILLRFEGDLSRTLLSAASGKLDHAALRWSSDASACVVVASAGYPGRYPIGIPIRGLEDSANEEHGIVFHAGTRRSNGQWVTAGGRVLGVCARAQNLEAALAECYAKIESIHFDGMHFRKDIGARALTEDVRSRTGKERREIV
jgi:phosphoribosylamine--glycine ligase